MWGSLGGRTRISDSDLDALIEWRNSREGRVAFGEPAAGIAGFAASHHQALEARTTVAAIDQHAEDAVFNTGTPLIYYVLAEAQKAKQALGCAGQSIVAQTFIQVLWDTPNSILHTNFRPDPRLVRLAPEAPRFSFGDLLVDTGLAPRTS